MVLSIAQGAGLLRDTLHQLRNLHAMIFAACEQGETQCKRGESTAAAERFGQIRSLIADCSRQIDAVFTGHGLGLPIVRKSVEALHGVLNIESKENQGARLTVVLPTVGDRWAGSPWFDLNQVAEKFALTMHDHLKHHQIDLDLRLNEAPVLVAGDELEMQRILQNLSLNARNAILAARRDKGFIMIAIGASRTTASLHVVDNGTGFRNISQTA
jgi:signal transduction histidine kinase